MSAFAPQPTFFLQLDLHRQLLLAHSFYNGDEPTVLNNILVFLFGTLPPFSSVLQLLPVLDESLTTTTTLSFSPFLHYVESLMPV